MVCDRYVFFKLAKIFHAGDFRVNATGHGNGGGRWAARGGDGSGELGWEARAPVSVDYSAHIVQDSQKKDVGERDCRE